MSEYTVYGKSWNLKEEVVVYRKYEKTAAQLKLAIKVERLRVELLEEQTKLDLEYMPNAVNAASRILCV